MSEDERDDMLETMGICGTCGNHYEFCDCLCSFCPFDGACSSCVHVHDDANPNYDSADYEAFCHCEDVRSLCLPGCLAVPKEGFVYMEKKQHWLFKHERSEYKRFFRLRKNKKHSGFRLAGS